MLDKKQNRKVLELKVYCTMKKEGCSWTHELGSLNCHLEDCQYVTISCTKGCGVSFQRHCLATHIAESCPMRDFTCQYCGFKSTYEEVCNKHWPECAKYPLPCPNKCGIAKVQRGSLEQHLNECPLQQVECEFCHAGCKEKIQRKDLQGHMEKNLQKHLSLLSAFAAEKITTLLTDVAEKDKEIKQLQSRVQNLENFFTLLPPVEFTLHRYSQYEGKNNRWKDGPTFYTCHMGHKIKIMIQFFSSIIKRFEVEVKNVEGEFDDKLQWPLHCTLLLQLLDQRGEHHLKRSAELQIVKRGYSRLFAIGCHQIKNHRNRPQYLKEDSLHFRVDVKPKHE